MPYLTPAARHALRMGHVVFDSPGQLNYGITSLAVDYVDQHGLSYDTINAVLGALEGAKLEFYRRVAGRYEDEKIKENGDVY